MSNSKVDVIILVDTKWVGRKWEIKSVAISYANNVLIPKGIAKKADEKVKKEKAEQTAKTEKEKSEYISNIENMLLDIEAYGINIIGQSNNTGKLFAKIDNKTLAKELSQKYNIEISPEYITCDKIENIWEYEAQFKYQNIKKKLSLSVKNK